MGIYQKTDYSIISYHIPNSPSPQFLTFHHSKPHLSPPLSTSPPLHSSAQPQLLLFATSHHLSPLTSHLITSPHSLISTYHHHHSSLLLISWRNVTSPHSTSHITAPLISLHFSLSLSSPHHCKGTVRFFVIFTCLHMFE